jgi:hypothetical protein
MQKEREVTRICKWKRFASRPIGRPKNRWEDDVRKDWQTVKVKNWKKSVLDRDLWNTIFERTKTQRLLRRRYILMILQNATFSYSMQSFVIHFVPHTLNCYNFQICSWALANHYSCVLCVGVDITFWYVVIVCLWLVKRWKLNKRRLAENDRCSDSRRVLVWLRVREGIAGHHFVFESFWYVTTIYQNIFLPKCNLLFFI